MIRNILVIIGIVICAVVSYVGMNQSNEALPVADKGFIDLSHLDFPQDKPVPLNGEWEFVSGQLVDGKYLQKVESSYVKVPMLWTSYEEMGKSVPKYTSATYRLTVKPPESNVVYGLKTNNLRMSNAIYVNGEKIGQSGVASEEKSSYKPANTPYLAFFQKNGEELEIIVHIANFHYATGGGIISPIYFGDAGSITRLREAEISYDLVMIAAFLIVGLFFLGFYFHFRKDRSLLFFALFCFSIVLYWITHGEKLLHHLFPEIPYAIFQRLQSASNLVAIFTLAYFHFLLREFSNQKLVKILLIIGILVSSTILLPIPINSQLQYVYSAYFLLINLFVLAIQLKAIFQRIPGSIYLLIGSATMFIYFIAETLNLGNMRFEALPPVLPFIYLLTLSLFMAHRFTDTYRNNEELSQKLIIIDQSKDEFLAKTSHEFRTPLHNMVMLLQTMLGNKQTEPLTPHQEEKLHFVIAKAKRLSSLVNDILDLEKVKRRELKLHIEPVDLFTNMYVITEVFTYILQKDVEIDNRIPRDIPYVLADENRLRQILYNLLGNAIKYTEVGKIQIMAEVKKGQVIISVQDTGIGIEQTKLNAIFQGYEQVGQSVERVGLGLSITKELVELQEGEIWVHSEIGKGSTFSFSLPLAKKESLIPEEQTVTLEGKMPSSISFPFFYGNPDHKKIIIADDNHSNIKVLMESLKTEPYYIIAVDNGNDVLKQLEHHTDIDLVVLDIMMPGLSGYEVCTKIREKYSLTELPVLMLTAALLADDMIAAFQSGANDFLHKPIDLAELKIRINNLLVLKDTAQSALNMEVAFLQAQIKPHFIYNVLNSIMSLSYIDMDQTRKLITNFANFLRGSFIFRNTDKWITIHKEIAFVQSYVEIEKARYPDVFQFEWNIENGVTGSVPPIVIQPIVENAIRHGISKHKKNGKIQLSIMQNETELIVTVKDNGVGMNPERVKEIMSLNQQHDGVGLLNIIKRLKQYPQAALTLESAKEKGTTVKLVLPYRRIDKKDEK